MVINNRFQLEEKATYLGHTGISFNAIVRAIQVSKLGIQYGLYLPDIGACVTVEESKLRKLKE